MIFQSDSANISVSKSNICEISECNSYNCSHEKCKYFNSDFILFNTFYWCTPHQCNGLLLIQSLIFNVISPPKKRFEFETNHTGTFQLEREMFAF